VLDRGGQVHLTVRVHEIANRPRWVGPKRRSWRARSGWLAWTNWWFSLADCG